ncbi:MAG: GNAT family N-acetyltransferase [Devosia sp.]
MFLKLRPAQAADHDAIAEIWHNSASLPGVGPIAMPTLAQLEERVPREVEAGWDVTIAVDETGLVGFLALKQHETILTELFVRPGSLGTGIGRALFAEAVAATPEGFTLFTRAGNDRARRFYERAGMILLREAIHPKYSNAIVYYGWNVRS